MKPATPNRGGVRTLQDLMLRCTVDDETGCWLWAMAAVNPRGAVTPMVHVAAGVAGQAVGATIPAARVAWLLSGRRLEPGHVVWRHVCGSGMCINPEHCRAGTRSTALKAVAATGRNRGKPERAAKNALARLRMVKPVDVVRQAEAMFAEGKLQKVVRAELGLSQKTAAAIRQGLHPHSSGRQHLVRGASVFSLGGAR